jgi:hypothetical protein
MRNAILLLGLLASCLPSFADSDYTKVTVKVTDTKGKPVDRANVRLVFKQGRSKVTLKLIGRSWELKTSQEGTAKLPGIPKGDVLIQVSMSPGSVKKFQNFGEHFSIDEDERTIEVVLNPPQPAHSVHGPNDPRATDEQKAAQEEAAKAKAAKP